MSKPVNDLSVSRQADRAALAAAIATLATSHGIPARIEKYPTGHPYWSRTVAVHITAPRGLRLTVYLDGDRRQQRHGVHVLSWHFELDSTTTLSTTFSVHARCYVNEYHRQKATAVTQGGSGPLLGKLAGAFVCIANGTAFGPEREAT